MKILFLLCVLPFLLLEPAVMSGTSQVHIGMNVQVSRAHETDAFGEVLLSSDSKDPDRILGCAILYSQAENRRWTVVYLSSDNGQSWRPTLETKDYQDSWDPACTLGQGGLAFHVAIASNDEKHQDLVVYRSEDGGKTWTLRSSLPMTFYEIDRESITVTTDAKSGNTLYITGQAVIPDLRGAFRNGFAIWHSQDDGMSFEGPVIREAIPGHYVTTPSNSVVLSDGVLVSVFADIKHYDLDRNELSHSIPNESSAALQAIAITKGGDWSSESVKVDDFFMVSAPGETVSPTFGMPTLAVDAEDGPFRDRLYTTWADKRDGRSEIRFAYSADGGKTWSNSIVIDDITGRAHEEDGPENFLPTVQVNKHGVVGVTWYDRRLCPDGLGWFVRFRASLDGGETWLPSVQVSEKPNLFSSHGKLLTVASRDQLQTGANGGTNRVSVRLQGRQFFAGDYAGLAADANGTFHAFWIDDRTGIPQIWTAPIVVEGQAIRNGSAGLAEFKDVSRSVQLTIVSTNYDRVWNAVIIGVRLTNLSSRVVQGPVKLRLLDIHSAIGSPAVANAENESTGPGAVWDFTALLKNDVLQPGESSATKQLVFRVNDPRALLDGKSIRYRLLDFDVRILARDIAPKMESRTGH